MAAILDELTIEGHEKSFDIILQHGGNDVTCKRSIVMLHGIPCLWKWQTDYKDYKTISARVITREGYKVRYHVIRSLLVRNTLGDRWYERTTMFKVLNAVHLPTCQSFSHPSPKAFPMTSEGRRTLSFHYQKETTAKQAFITVLQSCGMLYQTLSKNLFPKC